jgi:sulfane dehydrogenase subunit SoxC
LDPTRYRDEVIDMYEGIIRFGGVSIGADRDPDETGYVQPTRAQLLADRGTRTIYHFNGIASWAVGENGEVTHIYA